MQSNYLKFISNELDNIKVGFDMYGYPINGTEDFCTYKGWVEKGRKVKVGEKGMKIESADIYSQPLYENGRPVLDKRTGKQKFYKGTKRFVLFAVQQTETLTRV